MGLPFVIPNELYKILDLEKDATDKQIKSAYRKLAKLYHPDGKKADREKFEAVQTAYDILIDPVSRQVYDRTGVIAEKSENDIDTQAAECLRRTFVEIVQKDLNDNVNITLDYYPFKRVIRQLNNMLTTAGQDSANVHNNKEVLKQLLERIEVVASNRVVNEFTDPIGDDISHTIQQAEIAILNLNESMKVIQRAMEFAVMYNYRTEVTPPPPVQTGTFTSTATTSGSGGMSTFYIRTK